MNKEWIEKQWKGAELGDKRLTKRAVKIGLACLETPDGTLPKKFGSWAGWLRVQDMLAGMAMLKNCG